MLCVKMTPRTHFSKINILLQKICGVVYLAIHDKIVLSFLSLLSTVPSNFTFIKKSLPLVSYEVSPSEVLLTTIGFKAGQSDIKLGLPPSSNTFQFWCIANSSEETSNISVTLNSTGTHTAVYQMQPIVLADAVNTSACDTSELGLFSDGIHSIQFLLEREHKQLL